MKILARRPFGIPNGLGAGGAIQIASYAGIFLSLFVAAQLLTPAEFGLFAGLTATASLAGSVLTIGADKMLTNLASRRDIRQFKLSSPMFYQSHLFLVTNALVTLVATVLYSFRLIQDEHILTFTLALIISIKMVVGGYLRGSGRIYAGLIGIFSLQPLILAALFGCYAFYLRRSEVSVGLDTMLGAAAVIELCFVLWFVLLVPSYRFTFTHAVNRRAFSRLFAIHATIALRLTTWNLLAQSSLLSVAIVTATFSPIHVAQYGLACRVSQILLMPWNSGMQILIPEIARFDRNRDNNLIFSQIHNITKFVFFAMVAVSVGFLVIGHWLMAYFFEAFDSTALQISLVFVVGNLLFAFFGIGDQGLVALNYHRKVRFITVVSASIALVGYAVCIIISADIIAIAIVMMSTMLLRQVWCEREIYKSTGVRTRLAI